VVGLNKSYLSGPATAAHSAARQTESDMEENRSISSNLFRSNIQKGTEN